MLTTRPLDTKPIDVVMPVYNAPELTRRCVASMMAFLDESINRVYIQDDASDTKTREMLDVLDYPKLHVHHANVNQGFGRSVNEAIKRSDAPLILVLNSDVEVLENFLPPLVAALEADPALAVISPGGQPYENFDLDRYFTNPPGCVRTYRLRGHAFLIRRQAFEELGGFDSAFGRGYYEDVDLGRRLDEHAWRMGVHQKGGIAHKEGASFGRGFSQRMLLKRNRDLYYSRHPNAKRNVFILSDRCDLDDFPAEARDLIDDTLDRGARVDWLGTGPEVRLPALQMRAVEKNLVSTILRFPLRHVLRRDKQISEIWIVNPAPWHLRLLIRAIATCCMIPVRTWSNAARTHEIA